MSGLWSPAHVCIYIYICIERDMYIYIYILCVYIYIYIYIHTYIKLCITFIYAHILDTFTAGRLAPGPRLAAPDRGDRQRREGRANK